MAAKKKAPSKKKAGAKKGAPKSPEAIRKLVLADPNTEQIAKNLGVELEVYVDQVVHFVMNPKAEPSLYVATDEDLRKLGYEPPDADAMGRFIVEAVQVTEASEKTGYEKKKKSLPSVADLPLVGEEHTDAGLKKELDRNLKGKRAGKS